MTISSTAHHTRATRPREVRASSRKLTFEIIIFKGHLYKIIFLYFFQYFATDFLHFSYTNLFLFLSREKFGTQEHGHTAITLFKVIKFRKIETNPRNQPINRGVLRFIHTPHFPFLSSFSYCSLPLSISL